jgi:hypothetical protein
MKGKGISEELSDYQFLKNDLSIDLISLSIYGSTEKTNFFQHFSKC